MNLAKAKSNFPDNSSSSQETNNKQNLFEPFQIDIPEVKFILELRAVVGCVFLNNKPLVMLFVSWYPNNILLSSADTPWSLTALWENKVY